VVAAQLPNLLPSPSTSGPLEIEADIPLHLPWSSSQPLPVAAEAPSGAVFVAAGSVVYVVEGDGSPQIAEHAAGDVVALAASSTGLYVQTGLKVSEYNRYTGNEVSSWTLPGTGTPTSAGLFAEPGVVWSWTDFATDRSGFEYATVSRIVATGVTTIDTGAFPMDMDADANGLYYETVAGSSGSGHLARVTPSGARFLSPEPFNLDAPVALSAGRVVAATVKEPSGKTEWQTWGASSLELLSSVPAAVPPYGLESTGSGLLGLTRSPGLVGPTAAISRLNVVSSTLSDTVQFPSNFAWMLAGIYPAVVNAAGGELHLVRLS
jgi:hypothetical protein